MTDVPLREQERASSLPPIVSAALDRAAAAEHALDRIYPLFTTKLDSPAAGEAARELEAFTTSARAAHEKALRALRFWRIGLGAPDDVAAAYESLAGVLEEFARRTQLDADELD